MYLIAGNFDLNSDSYLAATKKDTMGDKLQTSIFLTFIGRKGREIYETFTFESGNEMKYAPVPYSQMRFLFHTKLTSELNVTLFF